MTAVTFRKISLFALTSVLLATSLIWSSEQADVDADAAPSYSVNVAGTLMNDVYIRQGKAYVPLQGLAEALGYEISYSLQAELDHFHQYDLKAPSAPHISVWGNASRGYTIVRKATQEMSVNDINIYEPELLCPEASDSCRLDESKYEGPVFTKNTLYVPVRDMAKAFNLKLTISRTKKEHVIDLSRN
ncbi:hypothetical protein BK142_04040 [Paenibacillus glucanolyticus]|nr:hypothetical protein BK142_04040 [Paenibacillus glucanolyticus]